MSVVEQSKVVAEVERHGRGKNRRLRELGISRSTYYWWRWRHRQGSWEGTEGTERPWNRLRPEEEAVVLAAAREMPPWRSPAVGGLALRPPRPIGLRLHSLSYPETGGSGETDRIPVGSGQRVPAQDHRAPPAVGHRCLLLPCSGMGLLLPRDGDGRLLPVHLGLEGATGHDGQLPHRGGPGSC